MKRRDDQVRPRRGRLRDGAVHLLDEVTDLVAKANTESRPAGVLTPSNVVRLGVGVTVVVWAMDACPPNVATKLLTNGSRSGGGDAEKRLSLAPPLITGVPDCGSGSLLPEGKGSRG